MLKDIIPAKYRQIVYGLYAVAVVVVGALAVGGVETGTAPDVLAYLGGALGVVAAANAVPAKRDDAGEANAVLIIAVTALVLSVLAIVGYRL